MFSGGIKRDQWYEIGSNKTEYGRTIISTIIENSNSCGIVFVIALYTMKRIIQKLHIATPE